MSIISSADVHNAIAELNKTNNIFRIKSIDAPFSDEIILNILADLNSGKLILDAPNLYDAFLGKNLLRLELQIQDLVKLQVISNLLENEVKHFNQPNCSFKVNETDSIISKVKQWKASDQYGFLGDISTFFSTLDHSQIFIALEHYKVAQSICVLIDSFLNQYKSTKQKFHPNMTPNAGLPVDVKISYVLANLVLTQIDDYFLKVLNVQHYARFIDDFYVSTSSEAESKELFKIWQTKLTELHLSPNVTKSRIFSTSEAVKYLRHTL